jgi:hypothetical protein
MKTGLLPRTIALVMIVASWPFLECAGQAESKPEANNYPMRLRLTWGGGSDEFWRVVVRPSDGTISNLEVLGLTADTPGSAYLENQRLIVAAPEVLTFRFLRHCRQPSP